MRVKAFSGESLSGIEQRINDFLESNKYEVVDIKWSNSDKKYSALVIFKF